MESYHRSVGERNHDRDDVAPGLVQDDGNELGERHRDYRSPVNPNPMGSKDSKKATKKKAGTAHQELGQAGENAPEGCATHRYTARTRLIANPSRIFTASRVPWSHTTNQPWSRFHGLLTKSEDPLLKLIRS